MARLRRLGARPSWAHAVLVAAWAVPARSAVAGLGSGAGPWEALLRGAAPRALADSAGPWGPVRLELRGELVNTRRFYTDVELGSPAQSMAVLVDTHGSFLTVPCQDTCEAHKCSPYEHSRLFLIESQTHKLASADSCPAYAESIGDACIFSGEFIQDGSAMATVVRDTIFAREGEAVAFGCYTQTEGMLLEATVSGILGLAPGIPGVAPKTSFARDLLGHFEHKALTLAFKSEGGHLIIGMPAPDAGIGAHLRLDVSGGEYALSLEGMVSEAAGFRADAASLGTGRAVVGSALASARLPRPVAADLLARLAAQCETKGCSRSKDPDNCFMLPVGAENPPSLFPTITLQFKSVEGGLANVEWAPEDYLIKTGTTLWCAGFEAHDGSDVVLGAAWLANREVTFVLEPRPVAVVVSRSSVASADAGTLPAAAAALPSVLSTPRMAVGAALLVAAVGIIMVFAVKACMAGGRSQQIALNYAAPVDMSMQRHLMPQMPQRRPVAPQEAPTCITCGCYSLAR